MGTSLEEINAQFPPDDEKKQQGEKSQATEASNRLQYFSVDLVK
jgi:hypothetical protein